jgi:hypothetical protein
MPIFRSTQVVYCCIWCSALGVVAEVLRSRFVVLCTVCKFVSDCWYLSSFLYMMHGHTYIKEVQKLEFDWRGINKRDYTYKRGINRTFVGSVHSNFSNGTHVGDWIKR